MQKIKATQRKTEGWGEMQTLPVKGGSVALEYFLSLHLFPRGPGAFPLAKVLLKGQLLE